MRLFRFIIYFRGFSPFVCPNVYRNSVECCDAATNAIKELKETVPGADTIIDGWKYHSWEEGEEEPKWKRKM